MGAAITPQVLCVVFLCVLFSPLSFSGESWRGRYNWEKLFCLFVFLILHFETADCSSVRACGWCFFFFFPSSLALPKLLCRSVNITCEFPSRNGCWGKKLLVKTSHPRTPHRPSHRPNLLGRFLLSTRAEFFFFLFSFFFLLLPPPAPRVFPSPVLCI